MNKIEQIELEIEAVKSEIEAVKTALLSFVFHRDDESKRIGYLDAQFQRKVGFLIYINFSEQRLQEEKGKLEDRLGKLQEEKNLQLKLQLRQIPEQVVAPTVFEITGVIKFGKLRGGCRQRLYRIAEEKHAKTRVGTADDGIAYQGITQHLQFKLVFEEKPQAEDFETAVEKIPQEYKKRKIFELPAGAIVVPDISVEIQSVQRVLWDGEVVRVKEDQYEKIDGDAEPSPPYDLNTYTQTSAVEVTAETRLRMLEREDSRNLFYQKPEKCHIVRQADDPINAKNPNNIVYMSRFLHQQLDAIDSTEGIPLFYFRYVVHSEQYQQGLLNNKPTPVYETTLEIVFKNEEIKNELTGYFKNPTDVNQTTIRVVAYFPNPLEFNVFAQTKAEETLARWASYDGLINA